MKALWELFNLLVGLAGIIMVLCGDVQQGTWFVVLATFLMVTDIQHEQRKIRQSVLAEMRRVRQSCRPNEAEGDSHLAVALDRWIAALTRW